MADTNNARSQMRKGILEYFVLLMLSAGKAYPSEIIQRFREADFIVVEGTVYTLLNRLRKEGKLSYEWQESREGPPRKYFFLTDEGRAQLALLSSEWDDICAAIEFFKRLAEQKQ